MKSLQRFLEEKRPQKRQKLQKLPIFNVFMRNLSSFRYISWIRMLKILNLALSRCPVGFFWRDNCCFPYEKSQIDTENDTNLTIFQVSKTSCIFFFQNFRRFLWIGTLKRVNKERICCPLGFSEELIPVV